MKTIILILVLFAVASASPADENKKSDKSTSSGKTQYDGNLHFNWIGDGSMRGTAEAIFKPILDYLKSIGINGNILSEGNAKGSGNVSGHFRFSGLRSKNSNADSQPVEIITTPATTQASGRRSAT